METQGTDTEATRTTQVPNIADTSNNRVQTTEAKSHTQGCKIYFYSIQ